MSANNYLKTPQGLTDAKLSVKVETSFSDIEIAKLKLELNQQKSCFNISEAHSPFHVSISGGIKAYFTNKEFNSNIEIIETIIIETFKKITDATIKKNIQDRVNYFKK